MLEVRSLITALETQISAVIADRRDYVGAQGALASTEIESDRQNAALALAHLGEIALGQRNFAEAEMHYLEVLQTSRELSVPALEAYCLHQLGMIFLRQDLLGEAEQAYRESARIKVSLSDQAGAARSWAQLAEVAFSSKDAATAELWLRKALEAHEATNDQASASRQLTNLAILLTEQPDRLGEARSLAERSLAIKASLDHVATEIWTTFSLLAVIADREDRADAARRYRYQERESYCATPMAMEKLHHLVPLVALVRATVANQNMRPMIAEALARIRQPISAELIAAIDHILDFSLRYDRLNRDDSLLANMVLYTVCRDIVPSTTVKDIFLPQSPRTNPL